jgi:hypothetical protein
LFLSRRRRCPLAPGSRFRGAARAGSVSRGRYRSRLPVCLRSAFAGALLGSLGIAPALAQSTGVGSGATARLGFHSVSCWAPSSCMAAGFGPSRSSGDLGAAARWNGSRWLVQAVPKLPDELDGQFEGISCVSGACTAVGVEDTPMGLQPAIIERWDGESWTIQDTPDLGFAGSHLSGVSCPSLSACVAVGFTGTIRAVAETWNGGGWSLTDALQPEVHSDLGSVSCRLPSDCLAVGYDSLDDEGDGTAALVEHWDGSSWTTVAVPHPQHATFSSLAGISCTRTGCMAVGSFARGQCGCHPMPFSDQEAHGHWTVKLLAGRNTSLEGVSCVSPRSCISVGSGPSAEAISEQWNGRQWLPLATPSLNITDLQSVSCTTIATCTAVGDHGTGGSRGVAELWNGDRWSLQIP